VSALGLVLVGIALCVLGVLLVTTGGQMTFTINEVLLGVGVVFIAAAVVRVGPTASAKVTSDELEAAWAAVHDATPPGPTLSACAAGSTSRATPRTSCHAARGAWSREALTATLRWATAFGTGSELFRKSPALCAVLPCLAGRYKRAQLSAVRFEGCPSRIDAAGRESRNRA
jgi:hypothetical protein